MNEEKSNVVELKNANKADTRSTYITDIERFKLMFLEEKANRLIAQGMTVSMQAKQINSDFITTQNEIRAEQAHVRRVYDLAPDDDVDIATGKITRAADKAASAAQAASEAASQAPEAN